MNIWTSIILIIVGLYDLAIVFNRRQQLNNDYVGQSKTLKHQKWNLIGFLVVGLVLLIAGIGMLFIRR